MRHTDEARIKMLREALDHLHSAVDLLDRAEAASEIGAWADMAASQLDEVLRAGECSLGSPSVPADA